jgi:hypothetical protein
MSQPGHDEPEGVFFRVIRSVALGTVLAVGAQVIEEGVRGSWHARTLVLLKWDDLNRLFNNRTTLATRASFGIFGFREAIKHERETTQVGRDP